MEIIKDFNPSNVEGTLVGVYEPAINVSSLVVSNQILQLAF